MSANFPTRFFTFSSLFSIAFLAILLMGCTGYQPVSYYQDGIYGETKRVYVAQSEAVEAQPNQSGAYYKNYFDQKAAEGIQDDYMFTDINQYQDTSDQQANSGDNQAYGSWGDQVDRINVNIVYNRPFGWGWGWYNAPFAYGRSSFWGYNYHPWHFHYDNFYNPYYYPYGYGWGSRWGYRNPWNYGNYWGPYNTWRYTKLPTYSRLNGGRSIPRANLTNRSSENRQGVSTRRSTQTRSNSQSTGSPRRVYSNENNQNYNNTNSSSATQQTRQSTSRSTYSNSTNSTSNNNSYRRSSSSSSNNYRSTPSSSRSSSSRSSSGSRSSRSSSSRRR